MEQTIVVGVDDSETANSAARTAARLAHALEAELVIVTAYGKFKFEPIDPDAEDLYITTGDLAVAVADAVVAELKKEYPDVPMTPIAAMGKPGDALVTVADRHDADLIVIGNKHVQGLARVFGSIAHHVAAHAPCDVYIANTRSRH